MKKAWSLLVLLPVALMGPMSVVARRREKARTQMLFNLALEARDNEQMIHWLRLGANPNVTLSKRQVSLNHGPSPLHKGCSALDYAIVCDDSKLLQACLDAHVDVNRWNDFGVPPLSTAIMDNSAGCYSVTHTKTAFLLLSHGANPNVPYDTRAPLADAAYQEGEHQCVMALLKTAMKKRGAHS